MKKLRKLKVHSCVENFRETKEFDEGDAILIEGYCSKCDRRMIAVYGYERTLDEKTKEVLHEVKS